MNPIYADFHVHTYLSPCGSSQATAEAMVRAAQAKGIVALGFADHITPQPIPGCSFYNHQRVHLLSDLRAEIAQVAEKSDIEILVGVEADYVIAGPECLDAMTLALADYVICAASHFHLPTAPLPADDTPRAKATLMLRMARQALALPGISVWAHPFDCSRMRPLLTILETVTEAELGELVTLANEREIAIEINGGAGQNQAYRQATAHFFRLAREMGARFTLTADAHHPDQFSRLDLALEWARSLGFLARDFLTVQALRERQEKRVRTFLVL